MEFSKQLITPELAKAYLSNSIANRQLKKAIVRRYAQDMISGRWKEDTGEVIKISKEGRPIDGYHRLNAVVIAGVSIWFHVATGVDESVFDVLDTGSSRSAFDTFKINDIPMCYTIPSIMQTYLLLKAGYALKTGSTDVKATNSQLLLLYYKDEKEWQSIGVNAMKWYNSFAKILPPSLLGGCYKLFKNIDSHHAYCFLEQLCTGMNISNNSIAVLRNSLMKDKISIRRVPTRTKLAYIIRTWNAYRNGQVLKIMKYDSVNDSFPKPI